VILVTHRQRDRETGREGSSPSIRLQIGSKYERKAVFRVFDFSEKSEKFKYSAKKKLQQEG